MRFGVREIANVVFKAKTTQRIGTATFVAGQPVLYIDSATASELSGESTTVYAQGGRGNVRLISWTGEKTLTFTVTDALLSPIGFSILSGAGLIKGTSSEEVHVHLADYAVIEADMSINLEKLLGKNDKIDETAPIFVTTAADGSIVGRIIKATVDSDKKKLVVSGFMDSASDKPAAGDQVFVDFYTTKPSSSISEIQIDANDLSGNFYVEGETLFRRESDGVDMPAIITLPNVKIQSSFTFSMSPTGDPSTFDFTMDALAGYTYFNKTKKVMCVIQIVEDAEGSTEELETVMKHEENGRTFYDGLILEPEDTDPGIEHNYYVDGEETTYKATAVYNDVLNDSVIGNDPKN